MNRSVKLVLPEPVPPHHSQNLSRLNIHAKEGSLGKRFFLEGANPSLAVSGDQFNLDHVPPFEDLENILRFVSRFHLGENGPFEGPFIPLRADDTWGSPNTEVEQPPCLIYLNNNGLANIPGLGLP